MKAEIKNYHSPDVFDLENYNPEREDNFCFLLQMLVGPKGEKGEESFDIIVTTPKWLLENHALEDIIIGKHYLIVFEYNYIRITNKLRKIVDQLESETWEEIARKIGAIGYWEFEDYQEEKIDCFNQLM